MVFTMWFIFVITLIPIMPVTCKQLQYDDGMFQNESCDKSVDVFMSIVKELQWNSFSLLVDKTTEHEGKQIVSYFMKNAVWAHLFLAFQNSYQEYLLGCQKRDCKNVVVFCGDLETKNILQFASRSNLISIDFHWLLILPNDFHYWILYLNTMNLMRPDNFIVVSPETTIEVRHTIYKTTGIRRLFVWYAVGTFSSSFGLELESPLLPKSLEGVRLNVAIVHDPPYVMVKPVAFGFEVRGLDIDAFNIVAEVLKFRYHVLNVPDNAYGDFKDGVWTGMLGVIQRREADMCLPVLSPTLKRQSIVDTTYPVSVSESRFLIRRPVSEVNYATYVLPFSLGIWCLFFLASILFFAALFFATLQNYDHHMNDDGVLRNNQFHVERLRDSFFAVFAIVTQRGTVFPHDVSSRVILVSFLILSMLLMWSYNSILVAFLTVEVPKMPFETMAGLVENKDFRVGYVNGSAYDENLGLGQDNGDHFDVYPQIYRKVYEHSDNLVKDNIDGISKAYNEKYAFLSWADGILFTMGKNCSLMFAGERILPRYYGMSMFKDSPYLEPFSRVLVRLKESGILHRLHGKYIPAADPRCINEIMTNSLDFRHIFPLFVLLLFGMAGALVVLLFEILFWKVSKLFRA